MKHLPYRQRPNWPVDGRWLDEGVVHDASCCHCALPDSRSGIWKIKLIKFLSDNSLALKVDFLINNRVFANLKTLT